MVQIIKTRNKSLDLFKTFLVFGMVWAHCFQLLSSSQYAFETALSIYVNIVTFSGFMFAFGWGSEIAYLRKTKSEVKSRLVKSFFVLLSVYYISGLGWHLFMDDHHSILTFAKIALLWRIPPYSEFLLSFAFLMIAIWLGFDLIVRIIESKRLMIYSICFCLLGSFIPYDYIRIPLLGVFIGTTKFACFPILQYSMFFLIGSWLSRNRMKISKRKVIVSLIMTGVGSIYTLLTHKLGTRFPPSIFWLSLAWLPICIYCLICNKIHIGGGIAYICTLTGKHTLLYLLTSNLIIFGMRYFVGRFSNSIQTLITAACILTICTATAYFVEYAHKVNHNQ